MNSDLNSLKDKKVWICSLGCRSNQYEAEALASAVTEAGAYIVNSPECDAAILVSCTVTAAADKKCRQALRKARRTSPGVLLAACGCWAQRISEEEARSLGISLLVGNRRKGELPALLAEALAKKNHSLQVFREDVSVSRKWDPLFLSKPLLHTRAFVKIQDGCNHFCTYCTIPASRGFPVSRDPDDTLREIRSIAASGCPEVVLTGMHIGLYGRYAPLSLAELLRKISAVEGIRRIRFGSIEPFALDDELLETLSSIPQFCPHLHLPLQSGSRDVLDRMHRGYTPEEYLALVGRARSALGPDVHISTNLLVGFPGEDEAAFADSLALARECAFGKIHVFPFSPREGTAAFSLPSPVPWDILTQRTHRALALGEELLETYRKRWIGRKVSVLVERSKGNSLSGLTPEYLRVSWRGNALPGEEHPVTISGIGADCLKGSPAP